MPAHRAKARGWVVCTLVASVSACGTILGIDPGTLGAPDGGASSGGDSAAEDGAHADAKARDGGLHDATLADAKNRRDSSAKDAPGFRGDGGSEAEPPTDGPVFLDAGIPAPVDGGPALFYVAPNGKARPCGSITKPCATITDGVAAAKAATTGTARAIVLVARGSYTESVQLASGVAVFGGLSADWAHSTLDGGTVVSGVGPSTLVAQNLERPVKLTNLIVENGFAPPPGGSVYGISATSDFDGGAHLVLENVVVTVGSASAGSQGIPGQVGPDGGLTCGASGDASTGAVGGPATNGGTFSITGFSPASGAAGGQGGTGPAGDAGGDDCHPNCVTSCVNFLGCHPSNYAMVCSEGPGGCGGGGGLGGRGGGGGGASIALYIWNVPVMVQGGVLTSGDGGNGGPGGLGGYGGQGGLPGAPPPTSCANSCVSSGASCVLADAGTYAGGLGTAGGLGGHGGVGGVGAGGPSYSVYWAGPNSPQLSAVTYAQGAPGGGSIRGVSQNVGSP